MIRRYLDIKSIISDRYSVLLLGPRGVGKTYLAKELCSYFPDFLNISFLDNRYYRRYVSENSLFKEDILAHIKRANIRDTYLVVIDEIQKIPELLDSVHLLIEESQHKVCFLLTGSSARKLKRSGANLLASRAISKRLYPLSSIEVAFNLEEVLQYGSMPRLYCEKKRREDALTTYVETYLKEEIQQEALTRNIAGFYRFLEVAGQLNTEIINYSNIAKQIGISDTTVKEYFQILADTLIGTILPAFDHSVRKQLTKASKFYFFDCGVINAICGDLRADLKKGSTRYGRLFETFIINEILRFNDYLDTSFKLSYWRTLAGQEVDLLLSRKLREPPFFAIEIKSSEAPTLADLRSLEVIEEEFPDIRMLCLCNTPLAYYIGKIEVLPWRTGLDEIFTK
jgi:predicted AAA+ superfamily ATPase